MRRFSNCLLLGLSLCVDSFGQVKNSTVAGVVSDEHSREVIRGAAVSVVGNQTNPTTTDDDGVFVMMVPQGVDSFRIRIEKSGYRIYEKLVPVPTSIPLRISLLPLVPEKKPTSPPPSPSKGPDDKNPPNAIAEEKPKLATKEEKPTKPSSPKKGGESPLPVVVPSVLISSMIIEFRLTCEVKTGQQIREGDEGGVIFEGNPTRIVGPAGTFTFPWVSPMKTWKQQDNRVVFVNRYALAATSDLIGRPTDILGTFDKLIVVAKMIRSGPIERATFFEVSVRVNGQEYWQLSGPITEQVFPHPEIEIPVHVLEGARVGHATTSITSSGSCTNDDPEACSNKELYERTMLLAGKIDKLYTDLNKEASDKLRVEREMDNNPNVTEAERERKVTGDQNAMNFWLTVKLRNYADSYREDAIKYRVALIKKGVPGSGNKSLSKTYENPITGMDFHEVAEDLRKLAEGLSVTH
jgi:hypothetical protein